MAALVFGTWCVSRSMLRWNEVTAEEVNVVSNGRVAKKLCTEKHRTHDQQTRSPASARTWTMTVMETS